VNLIANGSFETPAMANGAYQYISGGNVIDNWSVTAYPNMVARQNTVVGNSWNSAGASPDGVHMLILQYGGSVAQSVTVPAEVSTASPSPTCGGKMMTSTRSMCGSTAGRSPPSSTARCSSRPAVSPAIRAI